MRKKINQYYIGSHKEKCTKCKKLLRYRGLAHYKGVLLCKVCIPDKITGPKSIYTNQYI